MFVTYYLSALPCFAPTRWVFVGRCHCCLISAYFVSHGGGYVGYIRKALEKGYSEHPGSSCCTDGMFQIFVRFGRHVCFPLPVFVDSQLPSLHTNSLHVLLLPLMHHKSLWCAKGLALWVQSGCVDSTCCQAGRETSCSWFTATGMHPHGTPDFDHRRGHFFCKSTLESLSSPHEGFRIGKN